MADLAIQRDVPLAPLTTLELGGSARFFVRAADSATLRLALRWAREEEHSVAIMGGGSNLVVPDSGFDGLVVHMGLSDIAFDDDGTVAVGAGVPWELVVDGAVTRGWAGLECLTGIPGSTGATPIQNVGAYGQEVAEVLDEVIALNRRTLELERMTATDCAFGYRDSVFKREPDRYVVCGVRFRLRPGGAPTVRYGELVRAVPSSPSLGDVRSAVLDLRRRKSMVIDPDDPNRRSAGSFFLNPVVSAADARRVVEQALAEGMASTETEIPQYPAGESGVKLAAGWLIERAGIAKGFRRGNVGVSSRHALALVHHGGGTTAELLALADEVRTRVQDRFGITLDQEPRVLA
ncbi:MAG: UDP-N-acetylmuramate dehydrogenase [Myxococcota bacterium]